MRRPPWRLEMRATRKPSRNTLIACAGLAVLPALAAFSIANAAGVGGTGKAAIGVGGTGKMAIGVGGTGKTDVGVGGTGKTAIGVGGTGKTAIGVGGTG